MKTVRISLVGLAFLGLSVSAMAQEECDTLKWKTIKTYYLEKRSDNSFYTFDYLNGATINIDTLSSFYPGVKIVNISNDTFFANEDFTVTIGLFFYADTGLLTVGWVPYSYLFGKDYFPNDTLYIGVNIDVRLLSIVNSIKENMNIELEDISYWQSIIGFNRTSKDGFYSERVIYAGADTSTFRVVRGGVGVKELQSYEVTKLQVYPNPAKNQLTIEYGSSATLTAQERPLSEVEVEIYSVVGQCVMQLPCRDVINHVSTIDISRLASGMYFLKINNQVVKFIKE